MKLSKFLHFFRGPALGNALFVYAAYSFRFVSPLLLYPLLTRRLGTEAFGVYAAAYSMALMLSVVIEFGFTLSGTRDIALARTSETRAQIASKVIIAKIILLPVAALVGAVLISTNPTLNNYIFASAIAIAIGCAQGLSTLWYFQGTQRLKTAFFVEVLGQISALIAIVALVSSSADLETALGLQAAGFALNFALGATLMFRECPFQRTRISDALKVIRQSSLLFLVRASNVIFTTASVFILAGLSNPYQAALYGASERITGAFAALLNPLSALFMPKLVPIADADPRRGLKLALRLLTVVVLIYAVFAAAIFVTAPTLTALAFGSSFSAASSVLQILAINLPIIAANTVINIQILIPLRKDRVMMIVMAAAGAANVLIAIILTPIHGAIGMAVARLATESLILIFYTIYLIFKNQKTKML